MSTSKRLSEVLERAKQISFDDSSKFILFSDCHRGDGRWADDFAHNQSLAFHALSHYYDRGFTYIEIGDGDELWENRRFADIREAHSHVFWLMKRFYDDNRLYLIHGNHDMEREDPRKVKATLYDYRDERTGQMEPLFDGIEVHEGLALKHSVADITVFLAHGHQGDLINDRLWRLGRFLVRLIWRNLQYFGVKDPTSPAKSFKKRIWVEQEMIGWVESTNLILVAGHTHRSVFPAKGEPPYFNVGSCVHPRCITGIEIENAEITLIKWWAKPNDEGLLCVTRELLEGPKKLQEFC